MATSPPVSLITLTPGRIIGPHNSLNIFSTVCTLFRTGQTREELPEGRAPHCRTRGHGGADFFLLDAFLQVPKSRGPGTGSTCPWYRKHDGPSRSV